MPGRYLYQAYERKWRHFKIITMLEKLSLVIITLFFAHGTLREIKMLVASATVGFFFLISATLRPFVDSKEDLMDIVSRFANTLNVTLSYIMSSGHLNRDSFAFDLSWLFILPNAANVLLSSLFLLWTPIQVSNLSSLGSGICCA